MENSELQEKQGKVVFCSLIPSALLNIINTAGIHHVACVASDNENIYIVL